MLRRSLGHQCKTIKVCKLIYNYFVFLLWIICVTCFDILYTCKINRIRCAIYFTIWRPLIPAYKVWRCLIFLFKLDLVMILNDFCVLCWIMALSTWSSVSQPSADKGHFCFERDTWYFVWASHCSAPWDTVLAGINENLNWGLAELESSQLEILSIKLKSIFLWGLPWF